MTGATNLGSELSETLARYIARTRFEDLPASTVAATRRALVDGIGVMIAASGMSEDVQPFIATARAMGGPPQSSILGTWDRVGPAAAAFANGAMAHALDFEDAFDAAPTHPNASLIPALLATTQAETKVSGEAFITAMAIGCDISCRLALSVGDALESSSWYPPPILGAFGAVAAAAKVRGLNAEQITDAFSLMLCQTACPGEIKHSKDSVIRAVREAFPAQAAVVAAMLASQGVRGFAAPLEGRGGFYRLFANGHCDAGALLNDLGRKFYIDDLSFKAWPCCRGTHPYIEAAQRLRAEHGLQYQDIESICATIGPVQRMLCEPVDRKRSPATVIDAKFSIPFTVATAFIDPNVTLESFTLQSLRNRNVLQLAQRVDLEFREQGATATNGAIAVSLKDGRRFDCSIEQALGHPERPIGDEKLRAKFIDCATRAAQSFTSSAADALCSRLFEIDQAASIESALAFPVTS